ncbi:enoyl-CoA hydratase [Kribbella sp. VKM Ac-2527]|uniref:Enoyl-CoA hydratase n=1 Tax=Kribbella caucasensis TaxID=2512215 RepID=A0A4R6KJ30_9ACTN|nr:crotonase/enoyl-CoA hydratase family protein [Kribbella sp. VKM Ac-2527]TDO48713.1 enoyl-CoA hydratase [Kribbella sp. VKM Ac-2527]
MTADPVVVEVGDVLTETLDRVLVITINRPSVRNAVNTSVAHGIGSALDRLDADESLSAGVLAGAGPSFCAGMDLKAFLAGERPTVPGRGFAGLVERSSDKPLIAAVDGAAVAGGFEIVLACDLVVASRAASFGLPEVKRGLVAAGGGLLRLPQRIPYQLAMELALTGDRIDAVRGAELGLVNRLTEPGQARQVAVELAASISRNGPLALRATKQILRQARDWPTDEFFGRQAALTEPVRSSADAKEGARAFKERRDPVWSGR